MSKPLVRYESRGPIALLTLDRPEKRNALSSPLVAELTDRLERIAADPTVRAVVLTGEGTAFCAGLDMAQATLDVGSPEAERRAIDESNALADLIRRLHTLPQPTVAALNGDALAGGAGLSMTCDLVVMADHARIGYPEALRGLVAAIVMHDLIRLVGERRARELLLTARAIDSATALDWGLVNRVVPAPSCLDTAIELAERASACGPMALATVKKLLDEAGRRPADLRGPAAVTASVRVSEEAIEGMRAFLERRQPRWAR
ncbi:MAG: enoyl-CoA hydratase/isomerase family protein [Isosphaeraceae bacterium]